MTSYTYLFLDHSALPYSESRMKVKEATPQCLHDCWGRRKNKQTKIWLLKISSGKNHISLPIMLYLPKEETLLLLTSKVTGKRREKTENIWGTRQIPHGAISKENEWTKISKGKKKFLKVNWGEKICLAKASRMPLGPHFIVFRGTWMLVSKKWLLLKKKKIQFHKTIKIRICHFSLRCKLVSNTTLPPAQEHTPSHMCRLPL